MHLSAPEVGSEYYEASRWVDFGLASFWWTASWTNKVVLLSLYLVVLKLSVDTYIVQRVKTDAAHSDARFQLVHQISAHVTRATTKSRRKIGRADYLAMPRSRSMSIDSPCSARAGPVARGSCGP